MTDDTSTLIGSIKKTDKAEIRVTISTFKDRDYCHIREYTLGEHGDWLPNKKGVAIRTDDAPSLLALMDKLAQHLGIKGQGGDDDDSSLPF